MAKTKQRTALVCLFLTFLGMNATMTIHRWLGGDGWWFILTPAVETLVLAGILLAIPRLSRRKTGRVLTLAGFVYGLLVIHSTAEYLVQLIYGRPFLPQADIPMIRGVLLLLFGQIGSLAAIMTPFTVLIILSIFGAMGTGILYLGLRTVRNLDTKIPLIILAIPLILLFLVIRPPTILTLTMASSIAQGRPVQFEDVLLGSPGFTGNPGITGTGGMPGSAPPQDGAPPDPDKATHDTHDTPQYTFPGILDRDIYVFVIEAYGYAAHSREDLYTQLEPDFQRLTAALTYAGNGVVSNYLLSPVAGGFSWLAEATFLTGQWINTQPVFLQLYDSPVSTLTGFLYDGGYYTFSVKPGTVHGSWPEGWELFRFKESMVAYDGDFQFRGPWFSYVPITDQFAIHAAHQRLEQLRAPGEEAQDRPVFTYYQLVSSHTPFNRIPPYLENWDDLGDGSIYHELSDQILTFNNTWTGGSQLDEGFVASLSYVFTVISEYIDHFMDHDNHPIIIIFGDHQPQRPIREQNAHLSVPIHIASRDPAILQHFRNAGYADGLKGDQPPPHPRMTEFFPLFVQIATSTQNPFGTSADFY